MDHQKNNRGLRIVRSNNYPISVICISIIQLWGVEIEKNSGKIYIGINVCFDPFWCMGMYIRQRDIK